MRGWNEYGYEETPRFRSVFDCDHHVGDLRHKLRQESMAMPWYETYDNVTALGRWLLRERQFTAAELQSYYEKPWKWDDEWKEMQCPIA